MVPLWDVIGGRDKGGIVVRSGQNLSTTQLPERLATGARVREVELRGDRLHYELVSGSGPTSGWVSLKLKDKDLLARVPAPAALQNEEASAPQPRSVGPGEEGKIGKPGKFKLVSSSAVPVRIDPRSDAQVHAIQDDGDILLSTGLKVGQWLQVRSSLGRVGWIEVGNTAAKLQPVDDGTPSSMEDLRSSLAHAMLKLELDANPRDTPSAADSEKLASMTVKQLQEIINQAGMSYEGISEKGELMQLAKEAQASGPPLPEPGVVSIEREGRTAHICTPRALKRGQPLPLLINMHGAGKTDAVMTGSVGQNMQLAAKHNVLVLVPEAKDHTWDFVTTGQRKDMDFLAYALNEARRRYCVDDQRIALLGFSDGGSMALSLALNNSEIFQAAMVWAAGFFMLEPRHVPVSPKPRLFLEYGTQDELFNYNTVALGNKSRLQQAGYTLEFHTDEGGHHAARADFSLDAIMFWLSLPPRGQQGASDSSASRSVQSQARRPLPDQPLSAEEAVEWIISAADEFETLMLPLELQDDTSKIRSQFKRLSLQVHPDKNRHADAETAFKKLFGAMQELTEPLKQRMALRRARGKATGRKGDVLEEEQWWNKATVDEMERSFREMEQQYEKMGVFEFQKLRTKKEFGVDDEDLWISAEQANDLLRRDLAMFLDSRNTSDYNVSHVEGAQSLPGHTMEQLRDIQSHSVFKLVLDNPEQTVIVYSDNGSRMSRCTNVAQALRSKVNRPDQVKRLTGGLNQWKRHAFPVEGDARTFFAGKVLGDSVMRLK